MLIPLWQLIEDHQLDIRGVVHVGAHLGEEADAYEQVLVRHRNEVSYPATSSNVWWIEANPELIEPLKANVEPYGHQVLCALVTNVHGQDRTFHVTDNGQSSSIFEFGTHAAVSPEVHMIGTQLLSTTTLDHLVGTSGIWGCNFLNMDIQGAELLALQGAERFLESMDALYLEVNVDELYLGCARLPELDEFLGPRHFTRVATKMAGETVGWGDALWVRTGPPSVPLHPKPGCWPEWRVS